MSSEGTESCCRSFDFFEGNVHLLKLGGGGGGEGMYAVIGSTMLFCFKNRLRLFGSTDVEPIDRIVYLINVYIVVLYSL